MTIYLHNIPKLLGLTLPYEVERAHIFWPTNPERKTYHFIIIWYIHYTVLILWQYYRHFGHVKDFYLKATHFWYFLIIQLNKHTNESSFNKLARPFTKRKKLTLAYPATLHFQTYDGQLRTFQHPARAQHFIQQLLQDIHQNDPLIFKEKKISYQLSPHKMNIEVDKSMILQQHEKANHVTL